MGTIRLKLFTLVRKLYGWLLPIGAVTSELVHAPEDRAVADGVDYSRPFVLPGHIRRAMLTDAKLGESVGVALREAGEEQYRSQFGDPYARDVPFSPTTEDPLLEWDWATRERVLSNCHAAYARNPLANSIVQYTTQFVVGDGFNLSCKNKEVEKVLQAFIDHADNAIREYARQAVNDLQVDGELFLQLFTQDGETVTAPRKPWECQA